jgi:hypothetical protein
MFYQPLSTAWSKTRIKVRAYFPKQGRPTASTLGAASQHVAFMVEKRQYNIPREQVFFTGPLHPLARLLGFGEEDLRHSGALVDGPLCSLTFPDGNVREVRLAGYGLYFYVFTLTTEGAANNAVVVGQSLLDISFSQAQSRKNEDWPSQLVNFGNERVFKSAGFKKVELLGGARKTKSKTLWHRFVRASSLDLAAVEICQGRRLTRVLGGWDHETTTTVNVCDSSPHVLSKFVTVRNGRVQEMRIMHPSIAAFRSVGQ